MPRQRVNVSTSTHVRVRVSAALYHDGASDPSLATGRSTHLLFYDTIVRAWITQSGDMETRGNERGPRIMTFLSSLSARFRGSQRSCTYVLYPFTTSPHASCQCPLKFSFRRGKRGGLCFTVRVASRQAQGRVG